MDAGQWEFLRLSEFPELSAQRLDGLPDTCFWKSRLRNLLSHRALCPLLGIEHHGVYILSGPAGTGRHMTGCALIGELPVQYHLRPEDTALLQLRAEDFPQSMTAEEVSARLRMILETDESAWLRILVFDAMEQYAEPQIISNMIADYVEEQALEEGALIVICYTEDEALLSHDLRSLAFMIRTTYPSERQRGEFLRSSLEWETAEAPGQQLHATVTLEGITVEELARETDGMSYAELRMLVQYVRLSALERMVKGPGVLDLYCGESDVLDCIDMVRKHAPDSQIVQIQQASQTVQPVSAAENTNSRATVLAGKANRTFADNLELIQLVTTGEGNNNGV